MTGLVKLTNSHNTHSIVYKEHSFKVIVIFSGKRYVFQTAFNAIYFGFWGKVRYIEQLTSLQCCPLKLRYNAFALHCRSLKNFDPLSKEVNSAVIAINDVINYFNVRDKSLEVKPGNEVKIIIRPSMQNSTESFRTLGRDSKNMI